VFRRSRFSASLKDSLEQALALLQAAEDVVALTGAGISTPSGIPDFRTAKTGLWSQTNPFEVASIWAFHDHPQRFYNWVRPLARDILNARANAAHEALAQMAKLSAIFTQNIDGLHQQAGSQNVFEIHGNLRTMHCLQCKSSVPSQSLLKALVDSGAMPVCPNCGEILKPAIVLFGEAMPHDVIIEAQERTLYSDLMLVVGSSLAVMPAADLPALAVRSGSKLIIATLGVTQLDHLADVIIRGDVAKTLPWLAERLR